MTLRQLICVAGVCGARESCLKTFLGEKMFGAFAGNSAGFHRKTWLGGYL
jgi:hypothetical protein